jgi:predicted enzyme related to lactoylglutathione lyase
MSEGIPLIVYPAKDLAAATKLYTEILGVKPYAESPYYVGFKVGEQEFGLDPNGQETGPISYREVEDINATLQAFVDAGAKLHRPVSDVGGGLLVAAVKDADGNAFGLRQTPKSYPHQN